MHYKMRLFGISSALLMAGAASATPVTFLATDGNKLFRADSTGAVGTSTTLSQEIQSITRVPSGVSLSGAAPGDLIALGTHAVGGRWMMYRLDDPLGAATLTQIGSLQFGIGSLTFANGGMYGVNDTLNPLRVYKLDLTTGNAITTYNLGINASGGGGLAYNTSNGLFYVADYNGNRLYSWAPGGSATVVGPTGFGFSNNGMEFHEGTLYGALRPDSPSNILRMGSYDLQTGAFTTMATVTGVVGNGTGFIAVPEPATMIALGSGLLILARRKRRSCVG